MGFSIRTSMARQSVRRLAGRTIVALAILSASASHAALVVELTEGPGLTLLPPATKTAMMDGVAAAASKWSAIIAEAVTLKYMVDYDPGLGALGAAFDVYAEPGPSYADIKTALIANATSSSDDVATSKLQPGPALTLWINDLGDGPEFPPHIDADDSKNNITIDISRVHRKGLGILPADDGDPGEDGTLKFGSTMFDFDPSDGIDSDKFDFVGVAMHEMGHSMGFISGVDTLATKIPTPFGTPMPGPDGTTMVTVLDLFRYSEDSLAADPSPTDYIPDVSLPVPDFSDERYFSIDGGETKLGLFSTGKGLAGDTNQAGHWKDDPTFGLMDPKRAEGFALTAEFDALIAGPPAPDLIALDVIGWTITPVPEASAVLFGALACVTTALVYGRRRRSPT